MTEEFHGPMSSGSIIRVEDLGPDSRSVDLTCFGVKQRNWSRVGVGQSMLMCEGESNRFFLKQYLDRSGGTHPTHHQYEQTGAMLARQLLTGVVRVPALRFCNNSQLINVFNYHDVISIDRVIRHDPGALYRSFPDILKKMIAVLEVLKSPPPDIHSHSIPTKTRFFGGPSTALNFKGFDIRNVGFLAKAGDPLDVEELAIFDFVRPYLAPIEEAAAKLLVSIGLLNWGKPLHRFVRGPNISLLDAAAEQLQPYLDKDAVSEELQLQYSFRTIEFHGRNTMEREAKRLGISTIGRLYFHQLFRWCERNIG